MTPRSFFGQGQCTLGQDMTLCHYFIISLANTGNVFSGSLRCRQVRIHPEKVSKTIIPILRHFSKYQRTRSYGTLWAPTSSSCGGLVAFSRLEGPSCPLDTTPPPQVTLLSCILLPAPYGNVKNVPFLNLCHMTPLVGPQCSDATKEQDKDSDDTNEQDNDSDETKLKDKDSDATKEQDKDSDLH